MKLLKLSCRCICVLFTLTLLTNNLSAQKHLDIGLAHNWNLLDRDIEISVEQFYGKIGFKAGLNIFQHTAQESLTWERAYASNLGQRLGFHAAFLYRLPLRNSDVELSPFFKVTSFYLSQKQQIGENNAVLYPAFLRPSTSLGVQGKARLSGRLMLFGSVEAGAMWDFGKVQSNFPRQKGVGLYGLATGGAVGLAWRLKK